MILTKKPYENRIRSFDLTKFNLCRYTYTKLRITHTTTIMFSGGLVVASIKIKIQGSERLIIVSWYMGFVINSHHTLWCRTDYNPKGDTPLEYILAPNLKALKKGYDQPSSQVIGKKVFKTQSSPFFTSEMKTR